MSGYKGHLFGGLVVFLGCLALFHFSSFWVFSEFNLNWESSLRLVPGMIVVAMSYALVPDLDIRTSKINKFVSGVSLLCGLVFICLYLFWIPSKWFLFLSLGIFVLLFVLLGARHRGFCHNPLFVIALSVLLFFLHPLFFVVGLVSGLSHLVFDV